MDCQEMIYSNDYADFILDTTSLRGQELMGRAVCKEQINQEYAVIQVQREDSAADVRDFLNFQNLPRLFGLLDIGHLEDAGVLRVQRNPNLDLLGQNVILGVIDTGIDYRHPSFLTENGKSRIGVIWDQSLPSDEPDESFPYGSIYERDRINEAIQAEDPYSIVPSRDESGHGTFLAGVAAGSRNEAEDAQGAAPLCDIAVVKLKQAKAYLRDFWLVSSEVSAFQENDLFLAIRFIQAYARRENKPFVILLGCGTNTGNHGTGDYLKNYLDYISTFSGKCIVLPAGNEGGLGHHYRGYGLLNTEYEDVEIQVAQGENGFSTEFWAESPDSYTVGFVSPAGEYTQQIPMSLTREGVEVGFVLEPTRITLFYEPVERTSGNLLIWIRMEAPSPGIWRIRIKKENVLTGRYDIWLPMEHFVRPDTRFLNPDPDTTICEPGNARNPLTITAYDYRNGSLFFQASRGYTREMDVKPDFAAPGVNLFGPVPGGRYSTKTGTSAAAALAAGCVALLLSYRNTYTGLQIKNLLIRGTRRKQLLYPNREWGYGELELYESIRSLI